MLSKLRDYILVNHSSLFWRYRHLIDRNWTDGYLNEEALNNPHRNLIVETLKKYAPFRDLVEYGCGAGANLIKIHESMPDVNLTGIDISKKAVRVAEQNLKYAIFYHGDVRSFFAGTHQRRDVVLTDAVLIYVPPECMRSIQCAFMGIADKVIVMCEWHSDKGPFVAFGHHIHNYRKVFPGCEITKIPKDVWPGGGWEKYGSMIVWKRP